jgi:hypothetical protein
MAWVPDRILITPTRGKSQGAGNAHVWQDTAHVSGSVTTVGPRRGAPVDPENRPPGDRDDEELGLDTEDTAVPPEDDDGGGAPEPDDAPASAPGRSRAPAELAVVWSGIPIGDAFLHVVRADPTADTAREGRWAVVMDYSRHGAAERILPAGAFRYDRLPPRAALEMGAALYRALASAHARAVPAAIAPGAGAETRSARAGSAYAVARPAPLDTSAHMAPERRTGGGTSHDSDVYAAAATVVELLTGRPTALAPGDDAAEIDAACDEIRRRLGPSVPADAAVAALRGGLAHDPWARPAAGDLAVALTDAARSISGEGLDAFARRAATGTPPPPRQAARVPAAAREPEPREPLRIPWLELGAAASMALAMGMLLTMVLVLLQWRS